MVGRTAPATGATMRIERPEDGITSPPTVRERSTDVALTCPSEIPSRTTALSASVTRESSASTLFFVADAMGWAPALVPESLLDGAHAPPNTQANAHTKRGANRSLRIDSPSDRTVESGTRPQHVESELEISQPRIAEPSHRFEHDKVWLGASLVGAQSRRHVALQKRNERIGIGGARCEGHDELFSREADVGHDLLSRDRVEPGCAIELRVRAARSSGILVKNGEVGLDARHPEERWSTSGPARFPIEARDKLDDPGALETEPFARCFNRELARSQVRAGAERDGLEPLESRRHGTGALAESHGRRSYPDPRAELAVGEAEDQAKACAGEVRFVDGPRAGVGLRKRLGVYEVRFERAHVAGDESVPRDPSPLLCELVDARAKTLSLFGGGGFGPSDSHVANEVEPALDEPAGGSFDVELGGRDPPWALDQTRNGVCGGELHLARADREEKGEGRVRQGLRVGEIGACEPELREIGAKWGAVPEGHAHRLILSERRWIGDTRRQRRSKPLSTLAPTCAVGGPWRLEISHLVAHLLRELVRDPTLVIRRASAAERGSSDERYARQARPAAKSTKEHVITLHGEPKPLPNDSRRIVSTSLRGTVIPPC